MATEPLPAAANAPVPVPLRSTASGSGAQDSGRTIQGHQRPRGPRRARGSQGAHSEARPTAASPFPRQQCTLRRSSQTGRRFRNCTLAASSLEAATLRCAQPRSQRAHVCAWRGHRPSPCARPAAGGAAPEWRAGRGAEKGGCQGLIGRLVPATSTRRTVARLEMPSSALPARSPPLPSSLVALVLRRICAVVCVRWCVCAGVREGGGLVFDSTLLPTPGRTALSRIAFRR